MDLLELIEQKKKVIKFVDNYLYDLHDVKHRIGLTMNFGANTFRFEEATYDTTIKFEVKTNELYKVCADLKNEEEIKEQVNKYLAQIYFEEYIAQKK